MTTTTENTWQFDYHRAGHNSFEQWLLVTIMSGAEFHEKFETLSAVTQKFTDVQIDVRINNVAINAEPFFKRVSQLIESEAKYIAKQKVEEIGRINELQDIVHELENTVRREVRKAARQAGIELDEDY